MKRTELRCQDTGEALEIAFALDGEAFTGHFGGETVQGRFGMSERGDGWLEIDGRVVPFVAAPLEGGDPRRGVQIWMQGRILRFEPTEAGVHGGAGRRAGRHAGEVMAPMPGTIRRICVEVGSPVQAGAPLVIMESMKMEMTLSAEGPGVVEGVQCAEGQLVEMGDVLVRLKPSTPDPGDEASASPPATGSPATIGSSGANGKRQDGWQQDG